MAVVTLKKAAFEKTIEWNWSQSSYVTPCPKGTVYTPENADKIRRSFFLTFRFFRALLCSHSCIFNVVSAFFCALWYWTLGNSVFHKQLEKFVAEAQREAAEAKEKKVEKGEEVEEDGEESRLPTPEKSKIPFPEEIASEPETASSPSGPSMGTIEGRLCQQMPEVREILSTERMAGRALEKGRMDQLFQDKHLPFTFVGAGRVGFVVKANLDGQEYLIRPIQTPTEESEGFLDTQFGYLYEKSTQNDPKVMARSLACSHIGQQMARLSGLPSPTFDCRAVQDSESGSTSLIMTSAGDRDVNTMKKEKAPITHDKILSSILIQIFHRITGQLDGHSENVLFDPQSGRLCAIDPGITFPSIAMGSSREELIQNMATRYRAGAPGWMNTPQDAAVTFIKNGNMTKAIIMELPPLTPSLKNMLQRLVTDPERGQLLQDLIKIGGFTSQELEMIGERLDVLAKQLETVPEIPEGRYLELWNQRPSPFTIENCWLWRFYEGYMYDTI
jgi:hypothetical protein